MTRLRLIGLLLILLGAGGIVYGILAGQILAGLLFFIIPYLYGATALDALAILSLVVGGFLIFIDIARRSPSIESQLAESTQTRSASRTEWGGVVVIGPVPIIFGSAPRQAVIALAIAGAILTIVLLLFLFVR